MLLNRALDVTFTFMQLDVLLRISTPWSTELLGMLLRTMMGHSVFDWTLNIGVDWLERTNVLQFG